MVTEITEVKSFEDLREVLMQSKAEMVKNFDETAMNFAKIMTIKDLGLTEVTEEMKVALIGSIVSGTITSKMIEALDEEIEALTELIDFRAEEKEDGTEKGKSLEIEISEEDMKKVVEMIAEILGLEK